MEVMEVGMDGFGGVGYILVGCFVCVSIDLRRCGKVGWEALPALLLLLAVAACAAAAAGLLLELLQARLSDLLEVGVGHGGRCGVWGCICGELSRGCCAGAAKVVRMRGREGKRSGVRILVGQVPTYGLR